MNLWKCSFLAIICCVAFGYGLSIAYDSTADQANNQSIEQNYFYFQGPANDHLCPKDIYSDELAINHSQDSKDVYSEEPVGYNSEYHNTVTPEKGTSTIAFLGDSNLWLGGDDCSNPISWGYHVVENGGFAKARSFARSGATITNTRTTRADTLHYTNLLNDTNTLYNQALRLNGAICRKEMKSPDLIIVSGGSNDAWFQAQRHGIFDKSEEIIDLSMKPEEATSLRSSLRLIIKMLQSNNPHSMIVIVGPPYLTKTRPEAIREVADVMEGVAQLENLQMIRLDRRDLIDPDVEAQKFTNTSDGAHTLPAGAKLIGDFILSQLHIAK